MSDLNLIAPEAVLLLLACTVLLIDAFREGDIAISFWAAVISGLVGLAAVALNVPNATQIAFSGTLRIDAFGTVLKTFILVLVIFSFFYTREYFDKRSEQRGEYYSLALFATIGMMLLVSANSLLTVYLGLELLSLSLYALVALERDSARAAEAAMKYFVLGALASGMLLYGMSMIYGVTGSLQLDELLANSESLEDMRVLLLFGLVFLIVGIGFKLGVVPFHMWVPDVYHGAATPVTLFIGTAPKLAAFGMAMRLLANGLDALAVDWQQMLLCLAILSMAIGNIVAIAQRNIKRLLAYSTIAHMGFLLLGLLSATTTAYAASMFYVIVYALMSMGAFGVVIVLATRESESDQLTDLQGLGRRSPWVAFIMMILMFSLAGVPPFVGFWAKWFVLKELIAAGLVWTAALAVVFSIIGAYYYLRVVKLMYFDEPTASARLFATQDIKLVLSVNGFAILLLGLIPGTLMSVCLSATTNYLM